MGGALAGAGEPRRRKEDLPRAKRVVSWLVWWVLMMAFWVWIDDSLLLAELLVGAVAAALAATLAELAQYQAATHLRMRAEWLVPALRLPLQVARDTLVVLAALWRRLVFGVLPPSGFAEEPVVYGDDDDLSDTRRAVILGAASAAPNRLALGIDAEADVMVVHHLVAPGSHPKKTRRR